MENLLGIRDQKIKFSILYRAYLLDCLSEIDSGAEPHACWMKYNEEWKKFARQYRGLE